MPEATDATGDDRFFYSLVTTCPTPTVFPQAEITLTSNLSVNLTLYYALGGGGVNISGSVNVPALGSAVVDAELLSESRDFVIRFYDDPDEVGTGAFVASQSFTVATCLSVNIDCGSIDFSSNNEVPVTVVYGEGSRAQADPEEANVFVLDAGGSAAIRTDFQTLYWVAGSIQRGVGDNVVVALAGDDPGSAIPQDCEPAPLSTAIVGCAGPGLTARLGLNIEFGPTDTFAVEVLNTSGKVVFRRTGSAAAETSAFHFYETTLPGLGHYRFNYYLNNLTTPLESSVIRVQDCVDVEGSCRAATFSSASGNLPLQVEWSNGTDHGRFTLQPGRSTTVAFRFDVVSYRARSAGTDPRLIITAGGGASQKVRLRCPAGAGDDGLADTGVSGGVSLGLPAGLTAATTGTLLLARRRRSVS